MKRLILCLSALALFAHSEDELQLTAKWESPLVLPSDEYAHLLVRLKADQVEGGGEKARKLNLALIIDRSGSMRGAKIADARDAAVQMLDRMRDGDRVSLVSYSSDVRVDAASTILNETSRQTVRNAIHRISDDGSTNLGGGLVEGLKQVRQNKGGMEVNRVLLISDGLANRGITNPNELNQITRESLQEGIITTTIGLGADYNEDLMTGIADNGGGNYYFVEKSEEIAATLNDELGQMASTVAKNVALHIDLPEGIELNRVHGWLPQLEGETIIVPLGEFFSGQLRSVLWKFRLPENLKPGQEIDLGPLNLSFKGMGESGELERIETEPLKLVVSGDKDAVASARDMEVTARIAEIELATQVENATSLMAEGKYDEAEILLREAAVAARTRSEALPEEAKKDLLTAADNAEQMSTRVKRSSQSSRESKLFLKRAKQSAYELKKK